MIPKNKLYLQIEMKLGLVFILSTYLGLSQTKDSLLFQLQSIENDTERVNQIYKAGFDLRNVNPELAFLYATVCYKEALKTNSDKQLAKSYNLLGVLFYKKGDYGKALQLQKKSLSLNELSNYAHGIGINYINLGNIYSDIGYYKQAEYSYLQALKNYNKTNNNVFVTRCLINIGVLKFTQKEYDAAFQQFKQALNYATIINDIDLMATCNNNIGAVLKNQGKLDVALVYLEEGLKLRSMTDNELEIADSYINFANLYITKNEPDSAVKYLNLAEIIVTEYNYKEAFVFLYKTKYLFYESIKDHVQANVFIKRHYELKDSLTKIAKENVDLVFLDEDALLVHKENSNVIIYSLICVITVLISLIIYLLFKKQK